MVLTGAPLVRVRHGTRPPFGYRLVRWLNKVGVVSDERLELEKRNRGSSDYRAATGVMRDILVKVVNESYEEQLALVRGPVHLLWGAEDQDVPIEVAETAHDLLPDSTLEIVPGVGHLLPTQAPDTLRQAIVGARR